MLRRIIPLILIAFFMLAVTVPAVTSSQGGGTGGTGAMQGQITDRYGNPLPNATVMLNSGHINDAMLYTSTDEDGLYIFLNFSLFNSNIWRITVTVEYPDEPYFQARSEYKTVLDGQLVNNNLHLTDYPPREMGGLYGVLTSGPDLGSSWYEGMVYLTPADYPGVTLFTFVNTYPGGQPAFFSFDNLKVGEYLVRGQYNTIDNRTLYSAENSTITVIENRNMFLQVYLPYTPVDFVEYPRPASNNVSGYVTCSDGLTPLSNVNVSLQESIGNGYYVAFAELYTGVNGHYDFKDVEVGGVVSEFRLVMTYELDNHTCAWTSPDFRFFNSHSCGENVTVRSLVFNHSLEINITGHVKFESRPQNATIYINGEFRGNTPLTLDLPHGDYDYVLTHPFYANESGSLTVVRGQVTELDVSLVGPILLDPMNDMLSSFLIAILLVIVISETVMLMMLFKEQK